MALLGWRLGSHLGRHLGHDTLRKALLMVLLNHQLNTALAFAAETKSLPDQCDTVNTGLFIGASLFFKGIDGQIIDV